jgi:hypothetical protein
MNLSYHIHTYLYSYLLQHLTIGPSQPRSGDRLTLLSSCCGYVVPLVQLALVLSILKLFVITAHTSHTVYSKPPLQLYTSVNTSMHVNIMGVLPEIQIHSHTKSTVFLLVLLLDLPAGQLAPDCNVANKGTVTQFFLSLIFFIKHLLLVPIDMHRKEFKFFWMLAVLFEFVIDSSVYSPQEGLPRLVCKRTWKCKYTR